MTAQDTSLRPREAARSMIGGDDDLRGAGGCRWREVGRDGEAEALDVHGVDGEVPGSGVDDADVGDRRLPLHDVREEPPRVGAQLAEAGTVREGRSGPDHRAVGDDEDDAAL